MKSFLRVFIVILVAIGISFSMYFIADSNARKNPEARYQTTVTKSPVTEKRGKKVLLSELKKEDFHLYKQDELVILVHEGKEYTFENWSKYIDYEKPQMALKNLDRDKENEIIIKLVGDVVEDTGEKIYDVYVLNEAVNSETGEKEYCVTILSSNTWVELVDSRVKTEVSQLPKCDKIIQIAMAMRYDQINYDRDTGVVDSYASWFRALQDKNGNYLKIDKWSKGTGRYEIEREGINVYVPIIVGYKDSDLIQQAGYIKATLSVRYDYEPYVRDHSMSFIVDEDYAVHSQKNIFKNPWKYTENNSNKAAYAGGDKVIDFIKYETEYTQDTTAQTSNFANNNTELNNLSEIVVTESYVELVAKDDYVFNKESAKRKEFSVVITDRTHPEKHMILRMIQS